MFAAAAREGRGVRGERTEEVREGVDRGEVEDAGEGNGLLKVGPCSDTVVGKGEGGGDGEVPEWIVSQRGEGMPSGGSTSVTRRRS